MKLWPPPLLVDVGLARARQEPQEERAIQVMPWGEWTNNYGASAGVNVSEDSSLGLLTVYGAVQLIADTIAMLPRDIYRKVPGRPLEPVITPHWLEQPNPDANVVDFLTQTLTSLLLDGNAYWAYATDRNLTPTEIRVLNPLEVVVRDDGGTTAYYIRGERFGGKLLHIRGIMRPGALKGVSPVEAARQSIGLGLAAQQFAGSFYQNGTTLSGVITTDADLSPQQAKDLAAGWSQAHGGPYKAHRPGVLDNGAKWTPISITPEQAQFLESRKFQAGEIYAQMFLLDPTMLGIGVNTGSSLTYANLEQRGIHMVQFTLQRWITRLENAFYQLLPRPQYLKFNVNALMRADMLTRFQAHRIALGDNVAFETVNEVRELEELSPQPGGDTLPEPPTAAPVPAELPQANMREARSEEQLHFHMSPIAIHQPDLQVDVQAPEVRVEQPPIYVNVPAPEVHVAAPNVTVEAPNVQVDSPVTVNPEVRTPDVTVWPARVEVAAPNVHVDSPVTFSPEVRASDVFVDVPAPVVNLGENVVNVKVPAAKRVRREIVRDKRTGTITGVDEIPVD